MIAASIIASIQPAKERLENLLYEAKAMNMKLPGQSLVAEK
ncbi:hypothetical protein LOAG_00122 [Loa loa]|uniref:Uncharacterized protein n=1 Tax=Loa loa TaxID=7209 RepID=A0A1S0UBX7_LOALO|nr:hypothetical protein LOAG_00122 [Loa loa]EFO28345.1 hypothetical protein LOAG_00122 [Loa loa]